LKSLDEGHESRDKAEETPWLKCSNAEVLTKALEWGA